MATVARGRIEADLKRQMLERGMAADQIEQVLQATQSVYKLSSSIFCKVNQVRGVSPNFWRNLAPEPHNQRICN